MSKYNCVCGGKYKKEQAAIAHVEMHQAVGDSAHLIYHLDKRTRFWNWFLNFMLTNWRFIGGFIVYAVFMHHFRVSFNIYESIFIGLGMGMLLGGSRS